MSTLENPNLAQQAQIANDRLMWEIAENPPTSFAPSAGDPNSPDGVSPTAMKTMGPGDMSFAMIVILMLVHTGMAPIEGDMQQIANEQKDQDAFDGDGIDYAAIISAMEQAAGSGGFKAGTNISAFIQELKQFFGQAFGKMTQEVVTDSKGNKETIYVPVSGSSDFAKFIADLKSKYGADWFKNPAFSTIETMLKGLMTTDPQGGGGESWYQLMTGSGATNDQNFANALNAAAANYYAASNPNQTNPTPPGPNYFNDMYTGESAVQAALQGLGAENVAMLQMWAASLQSLTQTGQNDTSSYFNMMSTIVRNLGQS
jgi:hypothetical protein